MAEVDYISSAGIRILVVYARQLKAIHGRLSVINASENVRTVLRLAGLGTFLQVAAGPAAAPLAAAEQSSGQFALSPPGTTAEVYELDPNATLLVDWPGDSAAWLAALDPKSADQVLRVTEAIIQRHKLTTLMVTHSMSQAVNLGDRILMMHKGAVAYRFAGADKQRLGVEDLLARFEDLRRRELLDETAAALREETYA